MIERIRKEINAATTAYKKGIKELREQEDMLMPRIDHIECNWVNVAPVLNVINELTKCKKEEVQIYEKAIAKLQHLSDRVEREGILLGDEHTRKLNDLPKLIEDYERVVALHVAFEALHEVVKGRSHQLRDEDEAAGNAFSSAAERLLSLSRDTWPLQLRPSRTETPHTSVWKLNIDDMEVMDVKSLVEMTIGLDTVEKDAKADDFSAKFNHFHGTLSAFVDELESVMSADEDSSDRGETLVEYLLKMGEVFGERNYLPATREGIAFFKQIIARMEAGIGAASNDVLKTGLMKENCQNEVLVLTMASTVLVAQMFHLDRALHTFALSPKVKATLYHVRSKLDDLVWAHPNRLEDGADDDMEILSLSMAEKKQMYSELSDLPLRDDEAARHLRYLASELRTETQGGKDLDTVVGWLEEFAADLDEASDLTESVLGELILAGVKPEAYAAAEAPSEHWQQDRASGLEEDAGDAIPAEPSPARGSPASAEDSSLPDASRLSLRSPQAILQKEIDAAKRDAKPIEDNIDLMAKQASSNKREAEAVLTNLRNGVIEKGKTATAIYELLSLAVDRNKDRLRGLQQLIRRWEKIDNPGDEVRARISALRQDAAACEREIRTLTDDALRKTAEGVELYPTEAGALFLHRSGLIERMERPRWVELASYTFNHQTGEFAPVYNADGTPKVEYIHEWPIVVKRAKDSKETFMIYAHDHKKQDKEDPHPERLKDSVLVTWKNHYYVNKGRLWEQRMQAQGWSSQAAKVQRHRSGQGVLDMLAQHYIKDPQGRIPVEKAIRRFGRQ